MVEYHSVPTGQFAFDLGEGPVWNPHTERVSMVDIFNRRVYLFELRDGQLIKRDEFATQSDVGAALPLADGSFVLCEQAGIFLRDPEGNRTEVCELPVRGADVRCNDGKLGPDGKLWVGIMDYAATEGRASLWRIGRDGSAQRLLEGLTIPNGMDWCLDEFWFVNGPAEEIQCYHWDESGLTPTGRRFVTNGTPDGLAIDSQGELWLALWGEGRVDHFDTSGDVVDSISVASPHSTSLCFAGPELDTVIMTSAQFNMSAQGLAEFDRAGDVFVQPVPRRGRLSHFDFR
jgi:sugar lactone lactonase YvrE